MLFEVFSDPFEGPFLDLAANLSRRAFTKTLRKVEHRLETLKVPGIEIDIADIEAQAPSSIFWRPEIGTVRMGLNTAASEVDPSWLAGQFKVAAFLADVTPGIETEIAARQPVTVAGHSLHADRLYFEGDRERLRVFDGAGKRVLSLERLQLPEMYPLWLRNRGTDLVPLGTEAAAALSDGSWINFWAADTPRGLLTRDHDGYKKQVNDTLLFLEEYLPHYYAWIIGLMRELVALKQPGDGGTSSRSFILWPGQIHLSTPATFVQNISMLVHECSHQYFHLGLWTMPYVKPGAPEVYSVLKRMSRPFEKVLLGFHAFANVLLSFHLLKEVRDRFDDSDLDSQFNHVKDYVASLDRPLQQFGDEYLEEAGKEIYWPVRKRLIEENLL